MKLKIEQESVLSYPAFRFSFESNTGEKGMQGTIVDIYFMDLLSNSLYWTKSGYVQLSEKVNWGEISKYERKNDGFDTFFVK